MGDIFQQLRETLDGYGVGFPSVPGVNVAYLKKLFTEDHAQVFVAMEDRFQPVEEVAGRLDRSLEDVGQVLSEMAEKGLVMTSKTTPVFYAPLPWLTGWGDWTAYYEDEETARLMHEFVNGFRNKMKGSNYKRSIFRTVPVYKTIPDKSVVAPYDDIRKIIEQAGTISVADCYCDLHRKKQDLETCEPMERCFLFGVYADFLIEKGYGRKISREEAIEILNKCEDAGLVHNTSDLENPIFICNCPEYCGSNVSRRKIPSPFELHEKTHNYYAMVDSDLCTGCEECIDCCNLEAVSIASQGVAEINTEICVGCGICVTKCPTEALSLKEKDKTAHYTPADRHPNIRTSEEYEADLVPYKDIIKQK